MKKDQKLNKKVTSVVTLLFLSQNLFLPLGAQAQSTASQVLSAVNSTFMQLPSMYSQQATSPNFTMVSGSVEAQMKSCLIQSTLGVSTNPGTAASQFLNVSTDQWKNTLGLNKKDGGTTTGCDKPCTAPLNLAEEPSCSKYGEGIKTIKTETEEYQARKWKSGGESSLASDQKSIADYVSCLKGKKDCADKDKAALDQQMAAYNCQMQVMQKAVQSASQALQVSLQQNQKMFGDMNLHQKEVTEQMQQVDEILGPDPELSKSGASQFQGLLGLQKELNETLPKMVEAETKYKADIETIKNDTTTNEQNLEATRVNVASQCIKGSRNIGTSGGYSLTCFKPIQTTGKDGATTNAVDRNGNIRYAKQSCGPYEYIRSKIEQKAFITSRGVIMSQERREQAASNSVAFDSLVDSINRTLGDYDQKGSDNARLDVNVHSWSDVEQKLSGNIDAVASQSGVDVRSMLRAVAGHCFQEADQWKNQQVRSTSSDYGKKKAEIKARKTTLTAQMDTGLASMNKSYGDVMAVLANKHVTLSRSQCTKDNPDLMQDCFAKARQNLQNLLEGNGSLTMTAKTIKGGSSTPGFVVQCNGINGCVTKFKNVRDQQKSYYRDVQKKKEAYVNQSNQMTQAQLTSFSAQLSQLQNTMLAQYDAMKATMIKMGVDVAEKPKFMDPEQLQAMEGPPPEKSAGPFQNPKNMASVLSGMMQPAGMVNFGDTGLRDALKQVAEKSADKKAKAAEELKNYQTMALKYANVESDCQMAAGKGSGDKSKTSVDRVGAMGISCDECSNQANACRYAQGAPDMNAITAKQKEVDDQQVIVNGIDQKKNKKKYDSEVAKLTKLKTELDALRNPVVDQSSANISALQSIIDVCTQMTAGKVSQESLNEFNSGNMQALYNLSANPGCADIYSKCSICQKDGKAAFTESSKNGNTGSSSLGN